MLLRHRLLQYITAGALLLLVLPLSGGPAQAADGVAAPFRDYYNQHQGLRVLGHPLTGLTQVGAYPAQYFEKGRIEDHRADTQDPEWACMYGLLTAELLDRQPGAFVSSTNVRYADLKLAADPRNRVPVPAGFRGGTLPMDGGQTMFVPFDAALRPVPGHTVPLYFWNYITRRDLFPGGWLHDIGLPLTSVIQGQVTKNGQSRDVVLQAFERTVLSYDPLNPVGWQVERANIGTDAQSTLPPPAAIAIPAEHAQATLPLHLLVRVGQPGEQVTAVLRWQDGTTLADTFTTLRGEDGHGLLIKSLNFKNEGPPPQPPTQPAILEIRDAAGRVLAQRALTMLGNNDPNTMALQVYWLLPGDPLGLRNVPVRVPRTQAVGTAALQELLWGPSPPNLADFQTAIPRPEQVLSYPGRGPDWGARVTLRSLTIVNGVATADFSKEMYAYGGGSTRVAQISHQIRLTLMQFPTVRQVRIAIDGQLDALQP